MVAEKLDERLASVCHNYILWHAAAAGSRAVKCIMQQNTHNLLIWT